MIPHTSSGYEERLRTFRRLAASRSTTRSPRCAKYAGTPVTATEPVFGYMAAALGFKMRNERFQLAVMNDAEPQRRATWLRSRTI